jgi:hypothetical protein
MYRDGWFVVEPGKQLRCPCCFRTIRIHAHSAFRTYLREKLDGKLGPTVIGGYSYHHERGCGRVIEWYSERAVPIAQLEPPARAA